MNLRLTVLVGLLLAGLSRPLCAQPHPRIWLTPAVRAALGAKAASGDADWLSVKASADRAVARPMPRFTVVAATNGNPVRFTLAEPLPWSGSTPVFIAGATGAWSAVNASGDRPAPTTATRVGANAFTVPIDSSAFGPFGGQRLALFFSEGGYSAYGYEGLDWQSTLEVLGIAFQATGNPAYAAKGIELVDYIASLGVAGMLAPEAIDSGFPSRSVIYGLAIAYDWLYDRMTAAEKAAVAEALNLWFDWFKRAGFENNGPAYGNYFGGHVMGFGLAGLATAGDNPRGAEIAAYIANLFQTHVAPAFATGGFAGGYPLESYTYGANHFQRLLYYMLAVRTATGDDIVARTDYARKIARNLLYNLKPNNWQTSDEGDFAGDYTGILQPSLPIVLSSLLAGTDEGKWMQRLARDLAAPPRGGQSTDPFVRFVFGDDARPTADYRLTERTWLHSPGDEHLYRRSSWQDDAVWMSMAGGSANWAGHQMRGGGHIAIQRGNDYLLVNSGQWKGASGDAGTPQAFDLRSWRANTLFVDDGGDYLFTGADYAGGQGYWGANRVLAADGGAGFAYMKTDLATAYSVGDRKPSDTRSVRSFERSFLSTGNGVALVFDRVQVLKPSYRKKLYFHLNPASGSPAIAGNTASIRAGASALFIRTLLPAAPVLTAAADPTSDSDARPITYRLEVSDSVAGTTFNALNVLVATASTVTSMPAAVRVQSADGSMVGAMVTDGTVERIGLFAADGAAHSALTYMASYAAGQTGAHVIADLVPNAQYTIARDGSSLGVAAASSQGVLTFTSPLGGAFALQRQQAAASDASARLPNAIAQRRTPSGSRFEATPRAGPAGPNPSTDGSRFVAMIAPLQGERFESPATLRLVAVGRDPSVDINYPVGGLGGNADRLQFFVDDAMAYEMAGSQAEFFVFKGFAAKVAAGRHRVWARAIYSNPALVLDSTPVLIDVSAPPAYANTINLTADFAVTGDYQLAGTPASHIRVNGNGHRIVSGAAGARAVTFRYVDFYDVGDRVATDVPGIDLAASGAMIVDHCTFDSSNTVRLAVNGSAAATVRANTFRSNMRQPLGQYPDGFSGTRNGSFAAVILSGTSTAAKVFQANNVGAGWVEFDTTQNWLVGGEAASDGNVLVGPRVGIAVNRSTDLEIRRNYSHHVYFGGWSQGSNFELGGASSIVAEHNVIVGSSWPVRGVGGEFRYNLVLDAGHEWLWADHDSAFVHHNVFVGGDNDVGGLYVLYGVKNVRIENNTLDALDGRDARTAVYIADGAVSLSSNLFFRVPGTPVIVASGSLTANYNLSWASGTPIYSDGRAPIRDVTVDPRLSEPPTALVDIDEAQVWARTLTVADILARYRARYSPAPGSPALGAGDPAGGPGNHIGAVGNGANFADRFGR